MRFLKTLTLNRRAIYDDRVALDTNNTFTVANSTSMVLPKSQSSLTLVQTEGMIRYNTSTKEVEVYQGTGAEAAWRSLSFKEAKAVSKQNMGNGNGTKTVFGPLSPQPSAGETGTTWDVTQYANQIIVLVGNVMQIPNSNYEVIDGADIIITVDDPGPFTSGQKYIQFSGSIPGSITPEPVTVLHGFDR